MIVHLKIQKTYSKKYTIGCKMKLIDFNTIMRIVRKYLS